MKVVLQRVLEAQVMIEDSVHGAINQGYMLLVAIESDDTLVEIEKVADKIANLRVFEDAEGKMNLDIHQVNGAILSISQFTLAGSVRKGNRPSFTQAMSPEQASQLFDTFNDRLRLNKIKVETGVFGADMKVSLINDGPVTLIIETHEGVIR